MTGGSLVPSSPTPAPAPTRTRRAVIDLEKYIKRRRNIDFSRRHRNSRLCSSWTPLEQKRTKIYEIWSVGRRAFIPLESISIVELFYSAPWLARTPKFPVPLPVQRDQRLYSKREHGVWDPILTLTIISPNLIVDSEVQLFIPSATNADECFPVDKKWNHH